MKDAKPEIEQFVKQFVCQLENGSAAIFAGAGLSVPLGFVDWKILLKPLADDLGLNIDEEEDLVSLAQYHVNEYGNSRSDINNLIINQFSCRQVGVTDNHKILARLPIDTYWTTNYDKVIEKSLESAGKVVNVKHTVSQLPQSPNGCNATVYKMHGDVEHQNEAIITKHDYETFHITHAPFLSALTRDLVSKMFLFIGFSFTDPHLHYVLSWLRTEFGNHQRVHYCLLKRESSREGDEPNDLANRKRKQDFFIKDLLRYSIRCVMVDTYEEITLVLRQIEGRYKQRTVFVSGAAAEYGKWSGDDAFSFIHQLGVSLIKSGQRIVSGYGSGIGATLIGGALTQIYYTQNRHLMDHIVIRPFPPSVLGATLTKRYREDMLDYAGVAIFMFGNKVLDDGSVVNSDGVLEEFEMAESKGIRLLPLGFTGYIAYELWLKVTSNTDYYYPSATAEFLDILGRLGDQTLTIEEGLPLVLSALRLIKLMD